MGGPSEQTDDSKNIVLRQEIDCTGSAPTFANPPACYRSLSGPKSARSVPVPKNVPENGGVRGSVHGGPSVPGLGECPKSSPKVSSECQEMSRTLRGHSRDTFWTLPSSGPEGPVRHSLRHPLGTLLGHFGPEEPERLL